MHGPSMDILHVVQQFLPPLLSLLQDPIYIEAERIMLHLAVSRSTCNDPELLYTRVDFDFLLMDVLLNAPLIVIPLVEVISDSKPLMFGLLFLDIILGLLHIY